MNIYRSWGLEYLHEAEALKKRIGEVRAEPGPDFMGQRARRIQMLYDMYLECMVTGHILQKRGGHLEF